MGEFVVILGDVFNSELLCWLIYEDFDLRMLFDEELFFVVEFEIICLWINVGVLMFVLSERSEFCFM